MNWISGLQKAFDYIESHLTEDLEAADIAAQAKYSPYHFQRVFGILCGYSLGGSHLPAVNLRLLI